MNLYTDSSALLRHYLDQLGGHEFDECLKSASILGTAAVTRVEIAASLTRLGRGGTIKPDIAPVMIDRLDRDLEHMWQVPISRPVIAWAYHLAKTHSLKGYDAIQLGCALLWQVAVGSAVTLATFDDALWTAAKAEGMPVWPEDLSVYKP